MKLWLIRLLPSNANKTLPSAHPPSKDGSGTSPLYTFSDDAPIKSCPFFNWNFPTGMVPAILKGISDHYWIEGQHHLLPGYHGHASLAAAP